MRFDVLSLFPGYFKGPFDESIIRRAIDAGLIDIGLVDIRQFADNKHRRVDERPYGGGPGMVLMPQPTAAAIRSVKREGSHVVYMSPQGRPLTAAKCRDLAAKPHLIILCGHYEGIDERVLESEVDEQISIGDYVLTNGCVAAIVLIDAVIRFVPDVLGHESAAEDDSFETGLLEGPHWTRPEEWEGKKVPGVLLSGHHEQIAKWKLVQSLKKTRKVRPDLIGERDCGSAEEIDDEP